MTDYAAYIKQNVNIADAVERAGIQLRANSAVCPFHSEKTASFHIHPKKNIFKCFGCGAGGDIIEFVCRFYGTDFIGAVRLLNDSFCLGLDLERTDTDKTQFRAAAVERAVKRAYLAKFKRFELALLRYRRTLYNTIRGYLPPPEVCLFSDEYINAVNAIGKADYYLDIMAYGSFEDKKNLISTKEVIDIERKYNGTVGNERV